MNRAFWNIHKNKIMAIAFCGLGIAVYIAQLVFLGVFIGWSNYFAGFWSYINIVITSVVYLMLLITNIQNDNRAYVAIELLTVFLIYDAIWAFLPIGNNLFQFFGMGFPTWLYGLILVLTAGGVIGMGIPFLIFLIRYRLMRGSYEQLSLWAYLFVGAVALDAIANIVIGIFLYGGDAKSIALQLLLVLPDVFMMVACLFTLRRLRRF